MGMLGWVIMGLALWHFTIFLPDRFWGGIVGAFVGSLVGAIVVGLIINAVESLRAGDPRAEGDGHRGRALRGARRADRDRARVSRGHAPRTPEQLRRSGAGARVRSDRQHAAAPTQPSTRSPIPVRQLALAALIALNFRAARGVPARFRLDRPQPGPMERPRFEIAACPRTRSSCCSASSA